MHLTKYSKLCISFSYKNIILGFLPERCVITNTVFQEAVSSESEGDSDEGIIYSVVI